MKRFVIFALFGLALSACQESLEDRCEREAKEYTRRSLPTKVDQFTMLDSLVFERDSHTLHFYYTLSGTADSLEVLERIDMKSMLRNELKNTTAYKLFKDNRYNFAYTYLSTKQPGKTLYELILTKEDY